MHLHFAIDFDGTIALEDTTDVLLDRLAEPAWLDVETEWLAGRIGSRECLARQAALVRATPQELDAALLDLAIDPDFTRFVAAASRAGATMQVVSDGFDRCIEPLLGRAGLDLPVTCNRLAPAGGNRWVAEFPASAPDCQSMSGVCKCQAARAERTFVPRFERRLKPEFAKNGASPRHSSRPFVGQPAETCLVLIGDGRSDFCLASRADVVLAKGKLATHCTENNYSFTAINSFADVLDWLQPFLAQQTHHTFARP